MPVPAIRSTSRLCSAASRRTAGERRLGARSTVASRSWSTARITVVGAAAAGADCAGGCSSSWLCASTADPPVGPTGRASVMRYEVGVGDAGAASGAGDGTGAGAAAGAADDAGRTPLAGPLPSSTSAIGAPMGTVSPSWAMMRSNSPATGDGTSMVTLSVTTSTSGSYRSTWSPGCLSHLPMVPSTTLSPTWGSSINWATG